MVNDEDFAGGLFGRFDKDDDGQPTSSEWDDGIDSWHGEDSVNLASNNWDTDGNSSISKEGFTTQFHSAGLYDEFSTSAGMDTLADGIKQEDFSTKVFDWMDANNDDMVSRDADKWFN